MILNKIDSIGGYFPSSIKTIDYVKKKNVKSDATNVMYTRNYQTYYFNIGGYPSAYNMGLPGMFRYVRIWNYAKNFDLDKFVPDT